MRFPWQPQEYTRTCAQCGSTWQVPRSVGRSRGRLANGLLAGFLTLFGAFVDVDPAATATTIDSILERNRLLEASGYCPECGGDQFTQRASRGVSP